MTIERKEYIIGLHIEAGYSQISYCDSNTMDAVALTGVKDDVVLLPNKAFWGEATGRWYYGEEAVLAREKEEGVWIADFGKGEGTKIWTAGQSYTYGVLFVTALISHFEKFIQKNWDWEKTYLCLTGDYRQLLPDGWKQRFARELNISEDHIFELSKEAAFFHYILHQDTDIKEKEAALFDYSENGLMYYQYQKPDKKARVEDIQSISYQKQMGAGSFREPGERLDEIFCGILKDAMNKSSLSTVYLTGIGFEKEWLFKSLKVLCSGKRAFIGQNLFTKGSCYYMLEQQQKKHQKPYVFQKLGITIHTYEELCGLIFDHIPLFLDEFLEPSLLEWMKAELGLLNLAAKLSLMQEKQMSVRMQILAIMEEKKYLTDNQLQLLVRTIDHLSIQPDYLKQKQTADEYRKLNKYFIAHFLYEEVLKQQNFITDAQSLSEVYYQNGICLLNDMEYEIAKENFQKADQWKEKDCYKKAILFTNTMLNQEEESDLSEEEIQKHKIWMEKTKEEISQNPQLKQLMTEDDEAVSSQIEHLTKKWRQEYRTYLQ